MRITGLKVIMMRFDLNYSIKNHYINSNNLIWHLIILVQII